MVKQSLTLIKQIGSNKTWNIGTGMTADRKMWAAASRKIFVGGG